MRKNRVVKVVVVLTDMSQIPAAGLFFVTLLTSQGHTPPQYISWEDTIS